MAGALPVIWPSQRGLLGTPQPEVAAPDPLPGHHFKHSDVFPCDLFVVVSLPLEYKLHKNKGSLEPRVGSGAQQVKDRRPLVEGGETGGQEMARTCEVMSGCVKVVHRRCREAREIGGDKSIRRVTGHGEG